MIGTLGKALDLLSARERRQLKLLVCLAMVMGLFEVAGVASVLPFLAVLTDPQLIESQPLLAAVRSRTGISDPDAFLFFLGLVAFAVLLSAAATRMIGQYALIRFAQMRRHSIASRLLEGYLGQPYEFHLARHSGTLSKAILSEVDQFVTSVLQPAMLMLGHGVTLVAIAALLLIVDPAIALGAAGILGMAYAVVYGRVRKVLARSGVRRTEANAARFEAAAEALGGIREIKLLGRETAYLKRFDGASETFASEIARGMSLSDVPRYAIEAVAFGGILALSLVLLARGGGAGGSLDGVLPLLGLFAVAGYRMMPAIQAIYRGISQIGFGASAVDALHRDLTENARVGRRLAEAAENPLGLAGELRLEGVTYRYPGDGATGIEDVSLSLPARGSLGIAGGTGAGKTTLVDVILGLLEPQKGRVVVDGAPLDPENVSAWRKSVGYVPQDIFLMDASIAENIALGLRAEAIDMAAVRRAARLARIDAFIETDLASGYDTRVGERGVRLSGGQRQRIGIARALYSDPDVIVFDEATSALDGGTEAEVMAAIEALSGRKTLILVAHRLSTLRDCDRILVLREGRAAGLDSYERLAAGNAEFRKIAGTTT